MTDGAGAGTAAGTAAPGATPAAGEGRCVAPGRRSQERMRTVGGPPWWLPASLIGLGVIGLVAGLLALFAAAPDLADGRFYGHAQLGGVHLLGLAFLTVVLLAVLLQMVPTLFRRRVGGVVRTGSAALVAAAGSWALAAGLWTDRELVTAAGGALLVCGLGVFLVDLAAALAAAARGGTLGVAGGGMAAAASWLAVVLGLGALMVADRVTPFLELDRERLLGIHLVAGLLGWIGGAIVAMSLRLGPMLAMATGARRGAGAAAVPAWHLATCTVAIGLGVGSANIAFAGGVLLLAAALLAAWFVAGVFRRRSRLRAPLVHLVLGVASVIGAVSTVLGAWIVRGDVWPLVIPASILVLVGLGVGVTSGHLFEIAPMLVWTGRHAAAADLSGQPTLDDLRSRSLALVEVILFALGTSALVAGLAEGSATLARLGVALLLGAALVTCGALGLCVARSFRRREARLALRSSG